MTTDRTTDNYEVVLANTFEGYSPEDAVREMIEWLQGCDFWQLSYRVQREHQRRIDHIDASDLDPYDEHPDTDAGKLRVERVTKFEATDWEWAIVEPDGAILDRFATEQDATDHLTEYRDSYEKGK